ncbi:hypothetical protein [Microbacterium terricola]|uniref:Uncharacterized protein n=1 Tax=Microbacterium terricola TaxID=344163 RepID=A0ABM8DY09_9MICO|nr:hypothetical protein [Microbacterium terricola]UYK38771.1 hypothetical protein OAU46_08605 [Microbacterium terricola]BDV30537.1 hypothetical protein Microterr_11970 [Microbacterium terricola]
MPETTGTAARRASSAVIRLAVWTLAWIATLAVARFGPELLWTEPAVTWAAIAVNVAVGVGWIVVHAGYLRGVDDLQRKILMDAMAVALGVGLVGGFAYAAAKSAGLVAFESDIAFLTVLMGVVYVLAVAGGTLRYR